MVRRMIDVIGSLLALVLLFPIFLLVALAIKIGSAGPVFYTQARVGRGGKIFRIYKFRSMVVDAEHVGPQVTGAADPRVTRVGRLLRSLKLDEVPQLLNVLKGDMSLVGPRPEVPSAVELYTPEQREILRVKPGITGPTQLAWINESDMYPPGVDAYQYYIKHLMPEKLRSDLEYVRSRSILKDFQYLMRTVTAIVPSALSTFASHPIIRKSARLAIDILIVIVANFLAFLIRFDWSIPENEVPHLLNVLPVACVIYFVSFLIFRTYVSLWRYSSVEDLWQVIKASALGGGLHSLAVMLLGWRSYPRSAIMLTSLLTVFLTGGVRLIIRLRTSSKKAEAVPSSVNGQNSRKVVIIGAGKTGEAIAREIQRSPALGYELVGFIDDDPSKQGATIHNCSVLGSIESLQDLVRIHVIQEAIVAISAATGAEMRRIGEACARTGVEFKTLPSFAQLVRGEGKLRYLRKLTVDDLLRRTPTSVDAWKVAELLRGKRIMVTGAGGSIGSELCRQILGYGVDSLVMVERAENALHDISLEIRERFPNVALTAALADVKHAPRMSEIFRQTRPQIVFHAAAYKHVPILENHPAEAVMNNVVGTKRLIDVAKKFAADTFVFISTDKAVSPNNLMGATKKICEMYITALSSAKDRRRGQSDKTQFRIVRFGNVLGSAGSVVPLFHRQIENGGPITVTDAEVTRFFMTISEAVSLVLESMTLESKGDVFVLNMGEPVKVSELARDLVLSLGLSPTDIKQAQVGLRPGEKMHEALWEDSEEMLTLNHGKIFAVRQCPKSLLEVEALIGEMEQLAMSGSFTRLLHKIQEAVPSYSPPDKAPLSAIPEASERYRILVIDDNEELCNVLADALTLDGLFSVTIARTAREGFDRIKTEIPHLILLDVKLPDKSGLEICQVLRSQPAFNRIPIIMMTGYTQEADVVTGLQAGADDYLCKPFRIEELLARVEAILRRQTGLPTAGSVA